MAEPDFTVTVTGRRSTMFVERKIELIFQLGNGATLNPNGDNTVKLTDHRVSVTITKTVGPASGTASIVVYGLKESLLFKLASLNSASAQAQQNYVTVKAGDDKNGMAIVFVGQINLAQADLNNQPSLRMLAIGNGLQAMQNIDPSSYPGSINASVILANLAVAGGMAYKPWGVSKIFPKWYSWGDVRKQIKEVCDAAELDYFPDESDKGLVLHVWPKSGSRGGQIPLISPETGMVGYPTYSSWQEGGGIAVKTIFNPFLINGGICKVESGLKVANGFWLVFFLSHEIEANIEDGQWFTTFHGGGLGNVKPT